MSNKQVGNPRNNPEWTFVNFDNPTCDGYFEHNGLPEKAYSIDRTTDHTRESKGNMRRARYIAKIWKIIIKTFETQYDEI